MEMVSLVIDEILNVFHYFIEPRVVAAFRTLQRSGPALEEHVRSHNLKLVHNRIHLLAASIIIIRDAR